MAQSKNTAKLSIQAAFSVLLISVAALTVTTSLQTPAVAATAAISTDNGGPVVGNNINSGQRNAAQRTVSPAEIIAEVADSRPAKK